MTRNPFFSGVFPYLWLEIAPKFTMFSCDLGVEARRGPRNGSPRRSPKIAREECKLLATLNQKIQNRKKRIFSDGKFTMKPFNKYKNHGFSIIFDPKNRGR